MPEDISIPHWQAILKVIRDAGSEGVSHFTICEHFGVDIPIDIASVSDSDPYTLISHQINYLVKKGKIKKSVGLKSKKGQTGAAIIYQMPAVRRSRRDDLKLEESMEESPNEYFDSNN